MLLRCNRSVSGDRARRGHARCEDQYDVRFILAARLYHIATALAINVPTSPENVGTPVNTPMKIR